MKLWPNLTRENYMNLHHDENYFSENKTVQSILLWGFGSDASKDVTIFIPAFKRVDTLKETVQSILDQQDTLNSEIIIVDNSADTSPDNPILNYVKNLNNHRISLYVNEKNIGMIGNWNRGFELAETKYVAMLHDDDLLADNYMFEMGKALSFIKQDDAFGFIAVRYEDYHSPGLLPHIDKNGKPFALGKITCTESLFVGIGPTSCPTCGMIFSKDAVLSVGGFAPQYYPSTDYILGYQIMKCGYHGYRTNKKLAYYRIGINESTKKDVNIGFVMADYYFREYMYSENTVRRIFGAFFREVQYQNSVEGLYHNAKRFGIDLEQNELDFRHCYSKHPIRRFMFRALRKLYFSYLHFKKYYL